MMFGRPLSPWRGPEGPLARIRASRDGLAIIAVVTILLIGIVGIAMSAMGRDGPAPGEVDPSTEVAPPASDDSGRSADAPDVSD